jgi:hypothetical protein
MIPAWLRSSIAGLCGGLAWYVGMNLIFGPVQGILSNPKLQSAQMLAAFSNPRSAGRTEIVVIGLMLIGLIWGWAYSSIARVWPPNWWQRGLRFALLAWALMVLWFEFYLPWNVLREPAVLVALEMVCWAGVMVLVGLTIAGVETVLMWLAVRTT